MLILTCFKNILTFKSFFIAFFPINPQNLRICPHFVWTRWMFNLTIVKLRKHRKIGYEETLGSTTNSAFYKSWKYCLSPCICKIFKSILVEFKNVSTHFSTNPENLRNFPRFVWTGWIFQKPYLYAGIIRQFK